MPNVSTSIPVYVLAALSLFVAGTAAARPSASRRSEPVTMRIRVAQPGTSATVETADKTSGPVGRMVLQCDSLCDQPLLRGSYKLSLKQPGGALDVQVVRLKRPMQYTTLTPNSGLYALGVTLLISGAALAVGGFIAVTPLLFSALGDGGSDRDRYAKLALYGCIAAAAGGVLAAVGLLFYWTNHLAFDAEKLDPRALSLRMQLRPTASGVAATITGNF